MRAPQLASIGEKLTYTNEQVNHLKTECNKWLADVPAHVRFAVDHATKEVTFVLDHRASTTRISIIFGLVLNNIRSCLDHLVYQLVEANKGTHEHYNCFPFIERADTFDKTAATKALKGVAPGATQRIRELQPFNFTKAQPSGLDYLRRLDNGYKHNVLKVVGLTPTIAADSLARIYVEDLEIRNLCPTGQTLSEGGPFAKADLISVGTCPSIDFRFDFSSADFVLAETRESIFGICFHSARAVESVCGMFDEYFLNGSAPTKLDHNTALLVPGAVGTSPVLRKPM